MTDEQRAEVVRVAYTWLRTPFHHHARIKGEGVDCAQLLIGVYSEADVSPAFDPGHYPPDWFKHRSEEMYLATMLSKTTEVTVPQKGDIALFRFGRCFSHAAIIEEWPHKVIHAFFALGCLQDDASTGMLSGRKVRFFTPNTETV